ncbi:CBS domain-containing protein [Shewanella atlantica]|uniref:CBS domain-containing protein n=1 Tax=Shewanella atlantica TaxID=271099 RepID=A0A3S0ICM8_9GAMM|nr:CBS domain-containing protein [Shewanella atlantica]RTR30609.1 CBS domain-containing protein [Shewanella atlantica]
MKVSKLMSENIVTVEMEDRLCKVKDIFNKTNFHHLLVVDSGRLIGVISDRDLLKSLSPKIDSIAATTMDLACLNKKVHQIMTRKPISINSDATVKDAIDVFNTNRISCIPIISNEGNPVGILSWRDIMKALGKSK